MRSIILLFALLILPSEAGAQKPAAKSPAKPPLPLSRLVLVLDPGHGGEDPGANKKWNGKLIVEDEYVYDVTKRIESLATQQGARVYLTIRDPDRADNKVRDWPAQKLFPNEKTEVFSLDGSLVAAGRDYIVKRLIYANEVWAKAKTDKYRVVFVSIHFDSLGENDDIEGVRVITPGVKTPRWKPGQKPVVQPPLPSSAERIEAAFGRHPSRLRKENSLVRSCAEERGMRCLFILGRHNKIPERMLIELGNFSNDRDVWRIRDPKIRADYAGRIVQGLVEYAR